MWWVYQKEKRCLKIFSEWCFAKAVLKLNCLESMHAEKEAFSKRAEKIMTKGIKHCGVWCDGINLRHVRLSYLLRESRERDIINSNFIKPSVPKELVEEFV